MSRFLLILILLSVPISIAGCAALRSAYNTPSPKLEGKTPKEVVEAAGPALLKAAINQNPAGIISSGIDLITALVVTVAGAISGGGVAYVASKKNAASQIKKIIPPKVSTAAVN